MKKYFILFIVMFLIVETTAFAQIFKNKDLAISELEEHVWVVETSDNTTMYIIEGEEKSMLIDTGTKCDKLDEIVCKITTKPLYVVLTHFHPDHAGNIQYFDKIYMHKADTPLISMMNIAYKGEIGFVEDGDVFDLGGKKINVVFTPGHTPGSIVLVDTQAGSCYTGDAFGSGMVWLQLEPYTPMSTYIESCKKMEQIMEDKNITRIYCGHYPYVKKAFDKSYIVDMRLLAEDLLNGTAPEAKPFEMKASIGAKNPMIVTSGEVSIVYDPERIKK